VEKVLRGNGVRSRKSGRKVVTRGRGVLTTRTNNSNSSVVSVQGQASIESDGRKKVPESK